MLSTKFKAIFRICCARNGAKKQRLLFFRLVIFSFMHFFRLAIFPILIFLFMHFSSYPFRSFRLSVLCSLSAFVRCIPLCEYPQTRLASGQLRAGSVTLGSELRLGSDSELGLGSSRMDSGLTRFIMAQSLGLRLSSARIGAGLQARHISIWARLGDRLDRALVLTLGLTRGSAWIFFV